MKVPAQDLSEGEASRGSVIWLRVTRGLLFGVGGFDGNASLAVLATSLDDELAESGSKKIKDDGASGLDEVPSTLVL